MTLYVPLIYHVLFQEGPLLAAFRLSCLAELATIDMMHG
jgi:hypothetical protein